ncbi:MAG: PorT family protein [Bacteroides sp.]|nr:PorT family protein [Bacteroides sp.]
MKISKSICLVLAILSGMTWNESLRAETSHDINVQTAVMEKAPIYRNVYGELFGASDVIGVNYDQRFKAGSHWGFRAGIGYGFFSDTGFIGTSADHSISIPLAVNAIFGKKRNFFEVGVGYAPIIGFEKERIYLQPDGSVDMDHPSYENTHTEYYTKIFVDLGYRYQRENGFLLRAGLSPCIIGQLPFCILRFIPYVGIGYTF